MHLISLWIGKITLFVLQLLGRRGATLPGRLVELIDNNFMPHMLAKLPDGIVVVSGTNGKTTSTKMLAAVLKEADKKVLTNPTGSNFTRGVIASIVQHSTWTAKLDFDVAVIELDEAYAAKFVQLVKPRYSLILNVARDQMDRFGEIDHTAKLLGEVVKNTTETTILNKDDPRIADLSKDANCNIEYFGVADKLRDIFRSDDELHGDIVRNNIRALCVLEKISDEKITTTISGDKHDINLALHGVYNAQNTCAVITTTLVMGVETDTIVSAVSKVKAAFGRGERIQYDNKTIILQLVKNPSGFRHSIIGSKSINDDVTMVAINDDYADGRDVSWLWDVDFNVLLNKKIITSGTRANDMALRLSYDDIKCDYIEEELAKALDIGLKNTNGNGVLHIFTTYTAMLKLRHLIASKTEVEKV